LCPEEKYVKTGDLKPSLRNLNLIVKAVSIGKPRPWFSRREGTEHQITEVLVGDETGVVLLTLWDDQAKLVEKDNIYEIIDGYTTLYRGSLRLNIGRHGKIEKSDKTIEEINTKNNLSLILHQSPYWSSPSRRPFRRRRRR